MKSKYSELYNDGTKTVWIYWTNNIVVETIERKTTDTISHTDTVTHFLSEAEAYASYVSKKEQYSKTGEERYKDKKTELNPER